MSEENTLEDYIEQEFELVEEVTTFYSTIYLDEGLENKGRKTTAGTYYNPVMVMDVENAEAYPALFTEKEIERAVARASKNLEDFEGVDYQSYDPELVFNDFVQFMTGVSLGKLLKLWIMKKFGVVTNETIRRIVYGPQDQEGDS